MKSLRYNTTAPIEILLCSVRIVDLVLYYVSRKKGQARPSDKVQIGEWSDTASVIWPVI